MSSPATRTWPRGLQDIAEVIGPHAAVALADQLGGVEKQYIPMVPRPDHPFVAIIGLEKFGELCRAYGGDHIEIPRGAYRDLKKTRIMDAEGSNREVALQVDCTQRYVRKVRNDTGDPDQLNLLDD